MESREEKEIQENLQRVKQNIAQKKYYLEIKGRVLKWAKDYNNNGNSIYYYHYLFFYIKSIVVEEKLSRLQTLALTNLITVLLGNEGCLHEEIDDYISNTFYSIIYAEGNWDFSIPFSDDPPENIESYAWSDKWRMWKWE